MHVIVVGCGRVGSELAGNLDGEGYSVVVIDKNFLSFWRLPESFRGRSIAGLGFDRDHLNEAGIADAQAVAAVTSGDNSNILTARIARETFGIESVVARIYDPRRAVIYQRLGIPTVATVSWTTDQVMRRLIPGEQPHDWIDPTGQVCIVERALPTRWAGKKLAPLNEAGSYWLVSVSRFGAAEISTPAAIGQEGDVLHFMVDVGRLDELDQRLTHGEDH